MTESNNNFNLLQKLYKIVQPADLVGRYRVDKYSKTKPDPNVVGEILRVFVDTCDAGGSGLLLFSEIREITDNLKGKEEDLVAEIEGKQPNVKLYDNVEDTLGSLAAKTPQCKLKVISLNTPMLGISLRDTNRIGVFLNAIPSVELSRCVPRLEVNFGLMFPGEPPGASREKATGLSARSPTILRYLNGSAEAYGSTDVMMAKGSVSKTDLSSRTNDKDLKDKWKESSYVTSGMELFTTPQTLTSPDSTLQARAVPVLDRFASLMSIESLDITSTPAGGMQMNKTAKLNIVLHDRSRLHEIATLVRPDAYSRTTVALTYGWSHPDRSGNNPIADLINQMVVHDEKYNIVNSSFSFGGGGGVKIVLQLSMKGQADIAVVRIAENEKFMNLDVTLQKLSVAIQDARMHIPGLSKSEHFKEEVRAYQVIDAMANNSELADNFTTKDKNDLIRLIGDLQKGAKNRNDGTTLEKLKDVLTNINDYYNKNDEKTKLLKGKNPRVDDILGDKFKIMIGWQSEGKFAAAKDPFFWENAPYFEKGFAGVEKSEIKKQLKGESKEPTRFVSLAKLLLYYVGLPLQALGQYDELQFVYYPLNAEAGYAGATNLAGFPIEVQYFKEVMSEHAVRKGNANFTIQEFVRLLFDTVISDVRHPAYGMRESYAPRVPGTKDGSEPKPKVSTSVLTDRANKLAADTGGVFRKPVVEIQIEVRGGRPLKVGEAQGDKSGLQIIRIHVYDKLSSAYEPTLKVLQLQQALGSLNESATSDISQVKEIAAQIGLDLTKGNFNQRELKQYISQVVPVLHFGGNTSGILAATMQSMQNPDLATVNMQRAMGKQYNSEPNGSSVGAIPMRVQPSQLDLTLLGCPLLNGAQQYFCEFDTGTTVDDLYTLTGLSHRIAAGKFESTAKLTPMNSYGSYESISSKIKQIKDVIDVLVKKTNKLATTGV